MPKDEKELLEETYKLSEENNSILRKMRRSVIYDRIFRIIYWLIALGLATSLYYFIQPYTDKIVDVYKTVMTSIQKLKSVSDSIPNVPNNSGVDVVK
ncbi:MAG: Uncharacterized protein Athens071416_587 [Parcubacteria group bacterium Athens0714_16]|nr:MAG: Uncharacterized protein Athens071416_587 [Parcubacteria group bacterium Athens0714_16]